MGSNPRLAASVYPDCAAPSKKQVLRLRLRMTSSKSYFVGGRVVTVSVVRPWIQRAGLAPSVLMS